MNQINYGYHNIMTSLKNLPILASTSHTRRKWMESLRIACEIIESKVDETIIIGESPFNTVKRLSNLKAEAVAKIKPNRWIIAADTIVSVNNDIFGKPLNESDAFRMLSLLQGKSHFVQTGLCLRKNQQVYSLVDTSEVLLKPMTPNQINWYIKTGEPIGRAGAYSIQGTVAIFVEKIIGSFATVTGFPVEKLGTLLIELDLLEMWLGINK